VQKNEQVLDGFVLDGKILEEILEIDRKFRFVGTNEGFYTLPKKLEKWEFTKPTIIASMMTNIPYHRMMHLFLPSKKNLVESLQRLIILHFF
jgi:hypothetical protein